MEGRTRKEEDVWLRGNKVLLDTCCNAVTVAGLKARTHTHTHTQQNTHGVEARLRGQHCLATFPDTTHRINIFSKTYGDVPSGPVTETDSCVPLLQNWGCREGSEDRRCEVVGDRGDWVVGRREGSRGGLGGWR